MPLGTAAEELERKRIQITRLQPLYDRMDRHFDLWTQKQFKMPKTEGKWDSITSNSAAVLGNGIVDRLASARRKTWIPATDEDRDERTNLHNTELLVNAAFQLNDDRLLMVPESVTLQAALGWQATIRGILGLRVFLFQEGGEVVFDMAPWDPLHISWIPGGPGNPLPWVCFERWASEEEIIAKHGSDALSKHGVTADKNGRVLISDVWNNDQEGIIAGGGTSGKGKRGGGKAGYLDISDHDIGHPPVLILPAGSAPFVQSEDHTDSIKFMGASAYVNNEFLYEPQNRVLSYRMTLVKRSAKTNNILEYNSTLGTPPEVQGDPTEAGATLPVDTGKGQKWVPGLQPEMTRDADVFDGRIRRDLDTGGVAPIASGVVEQAQTFGGINLLTDSALQRLAVSQKTVEQALEWAAGEVVSQVKSADFGTMTLRGLETSNKAFEIKVNRDDIDDSWRFSVKLRPDLPQNEQIIAAVATQFKQSRLMATRDIQEKFQLVEDFDLTEQRLDLEDADAIEGIKLRKVARALLGDGTEGGRENAREILDAIEERRGRNAQEAQGGQPVQPGIPIPAQLPAPEAPRTAGIRSMSDRQVGRK